MGSQPKCPGPLAGTIVPSVRPWNKMGSVPDKYELRVQEI